MIHFAMQRILKTIPLLLIIIGMVLSLICFSMVASDEVSTVSRDLAWEAADPDDPESALKHKGIDSIPSLVTTRLVELTPVIEHNQDPSLRFECQCLRPLCLRC